MTDRADQARRRRANVDGGREGSHRVRVSAEEEAQLVALAAAAGVTVPRLLVESTLHGGHPAVTVRRDALVELFALHRVLSGVAVNINQIARKANAGGGVGSELAGALGLLRRVAVRIDAAVDELRA